VADRRDPDADLAAYLANAAYLESASVAAFAVLRDELRHHGAPRVVVRSAGRAARDEVRDARVMGALARRHGAMCRAPQVIRRPTRALVEIAVENAVEGCVRETYGAVIAAYQSRTAADGGVRAAMKGIARDEARYASLAWTIGAWIEGRLTPAEQSHVAEARREAVEELASSVGRARHPSRRLKRMAGIPGPVEASEMVKRMRQALWQC